MLGKILTSLLNRFSIPLRPIFFQPHHAHAHILPILLTFRILILNDGIIKVYRDFCIRIQYIPRDLTKPDNILLYATSNRRNLIRETWKDRADMEHENDVHHSDTLEEKLSLSARFGVRINYSIPNRKQFKDIVLELAQRQGLTLPEETLLAEANQWELRHGGVSGRTAQQFINYLSGIQPLGEA